jgi:hypothetical protein
MTLQEDVPHGARAVLRLRWGALAVAALIAVAASAAQVTVEWDQGSEPDLTGYRVHYGPASRSYRTNLDVGRTTSATVSTLEGGQTYYLAVTALDAFQNESGFSDEVSYTTPAPPETLSAPDAPAGATEATEGQAYAYATGGAFSNAGHEVQYRFSWADGTVSDWLPAGVLQAMKTWGAPGVYTQVHAEARCAQHPSAVSPPSAPLSVTVSAAPAETVSRPWVPVGATSLEVGGESAYGTGGAVSSRGDALQYRFLWSDGTTSEWLPLGVLEATKGWSAGGSYLVRAEARCAQHTSVASPPSDPLTVTVAPGAGGGIAEPLPPSGPAEGRIGVLYPYETGGAASAGGEEVEYRFLWGDGTVSEWAAAAGDRLLAWKSWTSEGSFSVAAEARSVAHPEQAAASAPFVVQILAGDPRMFFDTFADGAPDGDPDWEAVAGAWGVGRSKSFASRARRADNVALVRTVPEFATGRISTLVKVPENWTRRRAGVVFSYVDAEHYRYAALWDGKVHLGQVGDFPGEPGGIKAAAARTIPRGKWKPLRVDLHPDGEVRVYYGAAAEPAAVYRFAAPQGGWVGLAANRSVVSFDDFGIWDAGVLQ